MSDREALDLMVILTKSTTNFIASRIEDEEGKGVFILIMKELISIMISSESLNDFLFVMDNDFSKINDRFPVRFLSSYKTRRKYASMAYMSVTDIYLSIYGRFVVGMSDTYSRKYKDKKSIHTYEFNDIFEE